MIIDHINKTTKNLHMRYTHRIKYIVLSQETNFQTTPALFMPMIHFKLKRDEKDKFIKMQFVLWHWNVINNVGEFLRKL